MGRRDLPQIVTSYTAMGYIGMRNVTLYTNVYSEIFSANWDQSTVVIRRFQEPLQLRYVLLCVRVYTHIGLVYVYTRVCIHSCMYTLVYVYTRVCIHSCMYPLVYVSTRVCIHSCMYTLVYVYTCVCTHSCMHTLVYVYRSEYMFITSQCIHARVYTWQTRRCRSSLRRSRS
jgi:hypothetical protein